jgi:NAD(P)H dehydrogenase (quinone)
MTQRDSSDVRGEGGAPSAARKILIVYAHPEPRSLNGALKNLAVEALRAAGHAVEVSDLYAMGWKAVADGGDFLERDRHERLHYGRDSRRAHDGGSQSADIVAEQAKILRADALVLQFPLWWFAPPAILKGWIDRVFANGFAYGIGAYEGARYGLRYGEGRLVGKRALVSTTSGGLPLHYSDRGVHGAIDDLLFPLTHGTLYYAGIDTLQPFVVHGANRLDDAGFDAAAHAYRARLARLFTETPIAFRMQNSGDYDADLRLRPDLEGESAGLAIHRR